MQLYNKNIFGFGKHNGATIGEVCDHDPSYIFWCVTNTDLTFDEKVLARAQRAIKNRRQNRFVVF